MMEPAMCDPGTEHGDEPQREKPRQVVPAAVPGLAHDRHDQAHRGDVDEAVGPVGK